MTNFEKALENESDKYENTLDVIGWDPDVVYGAKNGFELGARWARQFTVEEICGFLKERGNQCKCGYLEGCIYCNFNVAAIEIKSHFSEQRQSDNGEERG